MSTEYQFAEDAGRGAAGEGPFVAVNHQTLLRITLIQLCAFEAGRIFAAEDDDAFQNKALFAATVQSAIMSVYAEGGMELMISDLNHLSAAAGSSLTELAARLWDPPAVADAES